MQQVDLLIKNGLVIDRGRSERRDVAAKNGRIVSIDADQKLSAVRTLDASGCIVSPGLIDAHTHTFYGASDLGIHADLALLPAGVTRAVDAGTSGVANYELFLQQNRNHLVKSKLFLNLCPVGIATYQFKEPILPATWQPEKFEEAFARHGSELLGLKLRMSRNIVTSDPLGTLAKAADIAHGLGKRLCIHVTNTDCPQTAFLNHLQKGDIYCHVFQGTGQTILDASGRVYDAFFEAQAAGVILDAASGKFNFSFDVARRALDQGLLPDIISSDLTLSNQFYEYVDVGLPYIMSKFLALGMPLEEVFLRATYRPAQVLGLEDGAGTLEPGAAADIAVFRLAEEPTLFLDTQGRRLPGDRLLLPQATVCDGRLVYKQLNFGFER